MVTIIIIIMNRELMIVKHNVMDTLLIISSKTLLIHLQKVVLLTQVEQHGGFVRTASFV